MGNTIAENGTLFSKNATIGSLKIFLAARFSFTETCFARFQAAFGCLIMGLILASRVRGKVSRPKTFVGHQCPAYKLQTVTAKLRFQAALRCGNAGANAGTA